MSATNTARIVDGLKGQNVRFQEQVYLCAQKEVERLQTVSHSTLERPTCQVPSAMVQREEDHNWLTVADEGVAGCVMVYPLCEASNEYQFQMKHGAKQPRL